MTLSAGRDATNDIFTPDVDISRQAAIFRADSTKVTVTDLSTTNGVYVNDERIPSGQTVTLKDKDIVRISGNYTLVFHSLRTK